MLKLSNMANFEKIINFFFEMGTLKRIPRSGWRNIGVKNPDSVAEHIFLTTQIAYILGKLEGISAERAALIALFHDNDETRIGDANLVTKNYVKMKESSENAFFDQIHELPGEDDIKKIYEEWKKQETAEAIVARDADWLELAIQAKCYLDSGNKMAEMWVQWIKTKLKTKSAQELFESIKETNIDDWWKEIPAIKEEIKKLH